jgi:hypothetical protein
VRVCAVALVVAACGRVGFDPGSAGDALLDDTIPVDGITTTAPCDTPTRIGTAITKVGLGAALEGTSYRVAWLDPDLVAHLLAVEGAGDTVTTRERTFPADSFQPMPLGADVTITQGVTVLTYWGTGEAHVNMFTGPDLHGAPGGSSYAGAEIASVAGSQSQVFVMDPSGQLSIGASGLTGIPVPKTMVDQQMTKGPRMERAAGGGVVVATARPTLKDCSVWTYGSGVNLLGTSVLPNDNTRCDSISAAYGAVADELVVAYTYQGPVTFVRVQLLTPTAQASGAPTSLDAVDLSDGPHLASSGSQFYAVYPISPSAYQLDTLSPALARAGTSKLHLDASPISFVAVASGTPEGLAVYTLAGSNELWMRRLCEGP